MINNKNTRLGDILKIRSSNRVLESDYVDDGVPFLRGSELTKLDKGIDIKSKLFITKDLFKELKAKSGIPKIGDLLITANGTVGNPYLVNINYDFYFKDAIIWIKQNKKVSNKYIYYVYKSTIIHEQIMNDSFGSTIINYNLNQAKKNIIPFHSLSQQIAIANYLDHHTTKLDKEISLLEQKVEKLDEYKQSLIYETVTKGLDKTVPMKDSGVEWIGMIPKHWEVKRVKDLFDLKKGKNAGDYSKEYILDEINKGENPVYSGQTENEGVMGSINTFEYDFPKGTLFTTTVGAKAMTVIKLFGKFSLSQNCGLLISKKKSNINWNYYMILNCFEFTKQNIPSYMQPSLRKEDLNNIFCFNIPDEEQKQIAEYLDGQCSKIDKKKELINKKIELLKEYKQSLIYEAVTGKVEIEDVYFTDNDISGQIYEEVQSFLMNFQKSFTPSYQIKNKEDLEKIKKELMEKKYGNKN